MNMEFTYSENFGNLSLFLWLCTALLSSHSGCLKDINIFHFILTLESSQVDKRACCKIWPHGGASVHSISVCSVCQCFPCCFASQAEWWELVVGQGLNEVQAHPPHTGKVTIFPELHDHSGFLFEEPHLSAQEPEEVLY